MSSRDTGAVKYTNHLHCLHFPSKFRQDNNSILELIIKEEIRVLFDFLLFEGSFLAGKICYACGQLPGDSGPLINQIERAYYRSHIIKFFNVTGFFKKKVYELR